MDFGAVAGVASTVIPVASIVSSAVNQIIRDKTAQEVQLPQWLLGLASVLNILSANLDKAAQLFGMFRGAGKKAE